MRLEHLVALNFALFVAIISPGPAFLVAVRTTLVAGRRAGFAAGCGLGLTASAWTLLALLGLDAIFRLFPVAYAAAKTAGAAYLIYVAWRMWKGARDPISEQEAPAGHAFRRGILINLVNPKSVMFAATVLVVVFPPNLTAVESAIVVANHFLFEVAFYAALACFISSSVISRRHLSLKVYLDRGASIVLGALGVRLLSDR